MSLLAKDWSKAAAPIAAEFGIDRDELVHCLCVACVWYQGGFVHREDDGRGGDGLDRVADLLEQALDLLEDPINRSRLRSDDARGNLSSIAAAARRAHRARGGGQRRDAALAGLVSDLAQFWRRRFGDFRVGEFHDGVPKARGARFVWECVKVIDPNHGRGLKNALQREAATLTDTTPNKY